MLSENLGVEGGDEPFVKLNPRVGQSAVTTPANMTSSVRVPASNQKLIFKPAKTLELTPSEAWKAGAVQKVAETFAALTAMSCGDFDTLAVATKGPNACYWQQENRY